MGRSDSLIVGSDDIDRMLRRIAAEIVEGTAGAAGVALVGVRRGGVPVARRLGGLLTELTKAPVPMGAVDIALYRDDAATALPDPKIGPSEIAFPVVGTDVVIVDDVLQTGRTIRAAIECLLDYGRPRRVWLAVVADRGGRELPISADFVGRTVDVPASDRVELFLEDNGPDRLVRRSVS